MPIDKAIVDAIKLGLEKEPESIPLRNYLGSLLLHAGDNALALTEFTRVLGQDPVNAEALKGAAAAASALGDAVRAEAYRKVLLGLSGSDTPKAAQELPKSKRPETLEVPADSDEEEADESGLSEIPKVTLADVGGMEEVKRRLNLAFLAPLRNPKMREVYGKSLRGGLLLYGPPGCGKTFIARATAGELQARFISIGLADVLDRWFGESEHKLHELFQEARRNSPTVIFFDEIDALGHKRSQLRGSGGRNIVNMLLSEMDGMDSANTGVFVLGATNHPWDVDSALRRPGRFDRMVLVLPPDEKAREAILRYHLKAKPGENIDAAALARQTREFSGADLAFLCEAATERAMEQSLETGTVRPLSMDDFAKALKEVRPSTRAWFDTSKNYAQFANEGGMYDDLLHYLRANGY